MTVVAHALVQAGLIPPGKDYRKTVSVVARALERNRWSALRLPLQTRWSMVVPAVADALSHTVTLEFILELDVSLPSTVVEEQTSLIGDLASTRVRLAARNARGANAAVLLENIANMRRIINNTQENGYYLVLESGTSEDLTALGGPLGLGLGARPSAVIVERSQARDLLYDCRPPLVPWGVRCSWTRGSKTVLEAERVNGELRALAAYFQRKVQEGCSTFWIESRWDDALLGEVRGTLNRSVDRAFLDANGAG